MHCQSFRLNFQKNRFQWTPVIKWNIFWTDDFNEIMNSFDFSFIDFSGIESDEK